MAPGARSGVNLSDSLVEIKNLTKVFETSAGFRKKVLVRAVDNVNLSIKENETLGLVGESGCGKTTMGRCILRLIEPTKGQVFFAGNDITSLNKKEMRELRRYMQIVFQNPQSSLDPRMSVEKIVSEPLIVHSMSGTDLKKKVTELLATVGLNPTDSMRRLPHQFSGGQRQRICIARALALNPKFIVLDEPTSSLDVSVQATVLNLLQDLQRDSGLAYLFISHNLCVIEHMSDRIAVMYLGRIVEVATKDELFNNPLHPYTKALLSAIPVPDVHIVRRKMLLKGEPQVQLIFLLGRFHPRCPAAKPECIREEPELKEVENAHFVACYVQGA